MKYILLVYLLTICLVASSGQQNPVAQTTDILPDSLKCIIEIKSDSIAMQGAAAIDSVYKKPRLIAGHFDLLPTTMQPRLKYTWWYKIVGRDTLYHKRTLTNLK